MNVGSRSIRFFVFGLSVAMITGLALESTAHAQRGRRGGGNGGGFKNSARGYAKNQARNVGKSQSRRFVQNNAKRYGKSKAKQVYQNRGKQIVKNKAQQQGWTKQQVLNNKSLVKNKLTHSIKGHARDRSKQFVQNHGKQIAKRHFKQQGIAHATRLARHTRWQHLRKNHHLCWSRTKWCGYYPVRCHWWYNYCGPAYYFDPTCSVSYDWYYYTCPRYVTAGSVVVEEARWHLGLKCVLIPGKGLGIETVEPGSPASVAGLTTGMIITSANGIGITDDSSMPSTIQSSGGLLNLSVLTSTDAAPQQVAIRMNRMVTQGF